jgi:hypothetical protein
VLSWQDGREPELVAQDGTHTPASKGAQLALPGATKVLAKNFYRSAKFEKRILFEDTKVNADGWDDVLVYGFPGQDASWFENPQGREGPWPRHRVLAQVDNESPTFADIDGDGTPEVVCSVGGFFGYAPIGKNDPTKPWVFHRISREVAGGRFTHGMGVGDVDGDGKVDILEKNGWWQQPASLESEPLWAFHPFPFAGPGGAQMHVRDVDGDGLNDVITSLAGHGYGLSWFESVKKDGVIDFVEHRILSDKADETLDGVQFSQLHSFITCNLSPSDGCDSSFSVALRCEPSIAYIALVISACLSSVIPIFSRIYSSLF